MIDFSIQRHLEKAAGPWKGVFHTGFGYTASKDLSSTALLEEFIHSTAYSIDSLPDTVKNNQDKSPNYLRQVFEIEKVTAADFRMYSKSELTEFLIKYINEADWHTDDRIDFASLLDWYFLLIEKINTGNFYVLSKDWFDSNDIRVRQPESWIYMYYFTIVWIDVDQQKLSVTEWSYD